MPQEDLPFSKMDNPIVIVGSGSIGISSTLDFHVSRTHQKEFSWRVGGFVEKETSFQWNVGDGEYYWYRVEGECGTVDCENGGVDVSQCRNMTFVTVVSARNVSEVCEILQAPRLNPPVNLRVAAIKKYSRPVLKGSVPDDQCNILEEQEFCQIPECLDYCIDDMATISASMSMSAIDFIEFREMSGGISLGGSSENNRSRRYDPLFPRISVSGSSACGFKIIPEASASILLSGTSSLTVSNIALGCQGSIFVSGLSKAISPSYYFASNGVISLGSKVLIRQSFKFNPIQNLFSASGSSEFTLSTRFSPSGAIKVQGMSSDYISPSRFYRPEGGFSFTGQAERNFEELGTIVVNSSMDVISKDFASDFNDISYSTGLTISNATVDPPCGCGPLGLSLVLRHNLFASSVINNFINKNNKSLPSSIFMKYRTSDSSWASNYQFSGSGESLSVLFSLKCMDDVWRLSFSSRKFDSGVTKHTRFIVDMPSEAICSDGNISTRITLGTKPPTVVGIPVVSPAHISAGTASQNSAVVDGLVFDYVVYYDEIGIFKDNYWSVTPFEMNIQPLNRPEMRSVDLERIFPVSIPSLP